MRPTASLKRASLQRRIVDSRRTEIWKGTTVLYLIDIMPYYPGTVPYSILKIPNCVIILTAMIFLMYILAVDSGRTLSSPTISRFLKIGAFDADVCMYAARRATVRSNPSPSFSLFDVCWKYRAVRPNSVSKSAHLMANSTLLLTASASSFFEKALAPVRVKTSRRTTD